jgi:hypothetical protein
MKRQTGVHLMGTRWTLSRRLMHLQIGRCVPYRFILCGSPTRHSSYYDTSDSPFIQTYPSHILNQSSQPPLAKDHLSDTESSSVALDRHITHAHARSHSINLTSTTSDDLMYREHRRSTRSPLNSKTLTNCSRTTSPRGSAIHSA